MSQNISNWFIEQFGADVQLAYQRMGSKLRNTIRTHTGVGAEKTWFNKAGKARVGSKTRGGDVPVLSAERSRVECSLVGQYVDDLDEVQTNVDERRVIAESFAYAHGRETDYLILTEMATMGAVAGNKITVTGNSLTLTNIQSGIQELNERDVPDDGGRFGLVSPKFWEDMLTIDAFANADYVGSSTEQLSWLNGSEAKRWRNILWMPHSALANSVGSGATATDAGYLYHRTCAGHAIGKDLTSTWSWENTKSSYFVNTRMLQGVCTIDDTGMIAFKA